MGMPEYEAKRYEGKVRGGNVLISVHSESGDETKRAKQILETCGARDISSAAETKPPKRKDRTDGADAASLEA